MEFTQTSLEVEDAEAVTTLDIKKYIQYCQSRGKEANITINGHIATLKVFYHNLVDEIYIDVSTR